MVRDTGEASERFLRSVAFREVDMKDARAKGTSLALHLFPLTFGDRCGQGIAKNEIHDF